MICQSVTYPRQCVLVIGTPIVGRWLVRNMNPRVKLRLISFEAAILLVVILIGWTGYVAVNSAFRTGAQSSEGIEERRISFKKTRDECFGIADQIQDAVKELNQALYRFVIQNDPSEWEHFSRKSYDVNEWIKKQEAARTTMRQIVTLEQFSFTINNGELIEEIDRAYGDYLASAKRVGDKSADRDQRLKYVEVAWKNSQQLLALSGQLRGRGDVIQLLQVGKPRFPLPEVVLYTFLIILVMLGGWFVVIVYRREVRSVRTELMASKTIIERQQKLAHFGELAAGLAHEIKQPLTAVKARLFALRKSIPAATAESEDAEVIETEINSLQQIVTEFLKLARPADPVLLPMSAHTVINDVHRLLTAGLQRNSIELKVDATSDTRFLADSQQLKQVLINLIQNAAESIDHDGTITLSARQDNSRLGGKMMEAVIIEVKDTGPGISPDVQKRLFDPFFSTKKSGTGLGLSISARIVEKHGGTLTFQSNVGRGATFGIVLPIHKENNEA